MKRTTISLPNDLAAALEREARRRQTSVSQVARDALEAQLGRSGDGARPLPFAALGASGLPGIASEDEAYLREHWTHEVEAEMRADGLDRHR